MEIAICILGTLLAVLVGWVGTRAVAQRRLPVGTCFLLHPVDGMPAGPVHTGDDCLVQFDAPSRTVRIARRGKQTVAVPAEQIGYWTEQRYVGGPTGYRAWMAAKLPAPVQPTCSVPQCAIREPHDMSRHMTAPAPKTAPPAAAPVAMATPVPAPKPGAAPAPKPAAKVTRPAIAPVLGEGAEFQCGSERFVVTGIDADVVRTNHKGERDNVVWSAHDLIQKGILRQ